MTKKYLYKNIKVVYIGLYCWRAYYYNPTTKKSFALCSGTTAKAAKIEAKENLDFLNEKGA